MSLCDTCTDPGHCCRQITLWGNGIEYMTQAEAEAQMRTNTGSMMADGSPGPFVFTGTIEKLVYYDLNGAELPKPEIRAVNTWSCPHLLPTGRCGAYENRPKLCKDYEPGSCRSCAMFVEGTDAGQISQEG